MRSLTIFLWPHARLLDLTHQLPHLINRVGLEEDKVKELDAKIATLTGERSRERSRERSLTTRMVSQSHSSHFFSPYRYCLYSNFFHTFFRRARGDGAGGDRGSQGAPPPAPPCTPLEGRPPLTSLPLCPLSLLQVSQEAAWQVDRQWREVDELRKQLGVTEGSSALTATHPGVFNPSQAGPRIMNDQSLEPIAL